MFNIILRRAARTYLELDRLGARPAIFGLTICPRIDAEGLGRLSTPGENTGSAGRSLN